MLIIIKCVSTQVQPPSIPLSIIIVTIFIAITIFCRYQYFHSENNFAGVGGCGGGDVVNSFVTFFFFFFLFSFLYCCLHEKLVIILFVNEQYD